MPSRNDLHEYQNAMINFVAEKSKCALFLDMGLGKTTTTLTAVSDFLDDFRVTRVLVIAPLRVANTVWKQEAEKWDHLNHLKISIATGTPQNRLAALHSGSEIVVINVENVQWLCDQYQKRWPFDMVVVDESSKFKSYKAKRFRELKKKLKWVKSVVLLTGTPSPEGAMDLWSQIFLLDNGQRLGRTITNFRKRFFDVSSYAGFDQYSPKEDTDERIREIIKDLAVTMYVRDVLELPERLDLFEYIELPPKAKKALTELKKSLITCLEDGTEIVGQTAGAIVNKMLQICNGAVYDENKNAHEIHDAKIQALRDLVEDNPSENFLVAYNFKSDLARLIKAFPEAVVLSKSGDELGPWNEGKTRILLAHPQSAGHGLNAQYGGSVIVWFGLTWSLELYQQFNARLHRQGQKNNVRIIHLVAKGGIDETICAAIDGKAANQKDLMDYLKYNL